MDSYISLISWCYFLFNQTFPHAAQFPGSSSRGIISRECFGLYASSPLVPAFSSLRSSRDLDRLVDTVRLGRVDLLARFCNLGQNSLVGERGDDLGTLVLEGDFVAFDA